MRIYDWQTEFFFQSHFGFSPEAGKTFLLLVNLLTPAPSHPWSVNNVPRTTKTKILAILCLFTIISIPSVLVGFVNTMHFSKLYWPSKPLKAFNGECCSPTTNNDWPATLVAEGGGREPVLWRCWCAHLQLGKVDCHQGSRALRVSAQTRWKDVTVVL